MQAFRKLQFGQSAKPLVPTAAPAPPVAPAQKNTNYAWILSPTIDLFFVCGGCSWIAYSLIILGGITPGPYLTDGLVAATLWWTIKVGVLLFNWGHQPATLWRVYMSPSTRNSHVAKWVTLWGLLSLSLIIPSMFVPGFINLFIKLIVTWGVQHSLAQVYGIALIYCYKRRYFLNNFEKQIFFWMINSGIAWIIVRTLVEKNAGSGNLNGVEIPFYKLLPDWTLTLAESVFVAFILMFLYNVASRYVRTKEMFPIPGLLTIASGILPYALLLTAGVNATFGLFIQAYFHGSQYLAVTSAYYLKERGLPEGLPASKISELLFTKPLMKYFGILVLIGWLSSDMIPRICHDTTGISGACTFGTMFCVLNFHHYFSDALIWKLKDPEVRKLLIA